MAVAIYAVQILLRMRAEEADGRLESVLAASVSRPRWLLSHLLNAGLGALLLLLVFAASMGLAAGAVLGDVPAELRALIGAGLVQLPAILLIAGVVIALTGLLPRAAGALSWAALLVAILLGPLFGAATLQLPAWAQDVSPFTHTPKLPAADLAAAPRLQPDRDRGSARRRRPGVLAAPQPRPADVNRNAKRRANAALAAGDGLGLRHLSKRFGVGAGARRLLVLGRARTDARLPRPERRRQDDGDARGVRARRARRRRGPLGRAAGRAAERLRFGYMPEERGLYPRMRVGEQLEYFGRLHGLDAARGARRRIAAGSSGSGSPTAPARRSRSSRTATSSARSSRRRWCTSRSCSCSTSRSPGSTRSRCARSPTCCAARRLAARPSSSPATSSSSSRTSARRSRSSTTAASSRRATWTRSGAARGGGGSSCSSRARRRSGCRTSTASSLSSAATATCGCWPAATSTPSRCSRRRERSARVVEFSYGPPSLAELFLELVAR